MPDEPLYEQVGRQPMSDEEIEAAIAAYQADNPDVGPMTVRAVAGRLRRLNKGAREQEKHRIAVQGIRDQAADDGIDLSWSLAEQALSDQHEADQRQRQEHDRRAAQTYAAQAARRPAPRVIRTPGRKSGSRKVGRDQIVEQFHSLREKFKRTPTQAELAANLNPQIGIRTLQEMLNEYGLPWPIE